MFARARHKIVCRDKAASEYMHSPRGFWQKKQTKKHKPNPLLQLQCLPSKKVSVTNYFSAALLY